MQAEQLACALHAYYYRSVRDGNYAPNFLPVDEYGEHFKAMDSIIPVGDQKDRTYGCSWI